MRSSSDLTSEITYETLAEESALTSYVTPLSQPNTDSQDAQSEHRLKNKILAGPSESATSSSTSSSQECVTPFSTSQDFEIPRLPELIVIAAVDKLPDNINEPPSPTTMGKYERGISQFGLTHPIRIIKNALKNDFEQNQYLGIVQNSQSETIQSFQAALDSVLRSWLFKHPSPSCQMTYSILNLIETQNQQQNKSMLERALSTSDNKRVLPMLRFGFITDMTFNTKTGKPKKIHTNTKEEYEWLSIASKVHAFRIMSLYSSIDGVLKFIHDNQHSNTLKYEYNKTSHSLKGKTFVQKTIDVMREQFFDPQGIIYLICLSVGGPSEVPYRVHRLCSCGDSLLETLRFVYTSDKEVLNRLEFSDKFKDKILELCGYNEAQSITIRRNLLDAQQQLTIK